jgi:hypothetical protein
MRRLILATGILVVTSIGWADAIRTQVSVAVSNCGDTEISPFNQNGTGPIDSGTLQTLPSPCPFPTNGIAVGRGEANPLGGIFDVSGSATTTSLGTAARSDAESFALVTLLPPAVDFDGSVTVIAGVGYDIVADSGDSDEGAGVASITISIPTVDDVPLTLPITDSRVVTDGELSGTFSEEFTILGCPCDFVFDVQGSANASNGGSAGYHDPFFVDLPPGWSYTIASDESPAAAPEPGSLVLFGGGILLLTAGSSRRRASRK